MPRPSKHTHQYEKEHEEMRAMAGWIVRITYSECTWPRCQHRKRDVEKVQKL